MTKVDKTKLVNYWRQGSYFELASAVAISEKAKRNVQACFFLHLAVEKILKAYIVYKTGNHAPYVHNLPQLARLSKLEFTKKQLAFLVETHDFNMRCRYPDDKYKIYKVTNARKTTKLLKEAKEFIPWISEKLKQ